MQLAAYKEGFPLLIPRSLLRGSSLIINGREGYIQ